jgi:hypothetical protein
MIICLRHIVQLSENDKNVVLSQVQSIYSRSELDIKTIEYVVENIYNFTIRNNNLWRKQTVGMTTLQQVVSNMFLKELYRHILSIKIT